METYYIMLENVIVNKTRSYESILAHDCDNHKWAAMSILEEVADLLENPEEPIIFQIELEDIYDTDEINQAVRQWIKDEHNVTLELSQYEYTVADTRQDLLKDHEEEEDEPHDEDPEIVAFTDIPEEEDIIEDPEEEDEEEDEDEAPKYVQALANWYLFTSNLLNDIILLGEEDPCTEVPETTMKQLSRAVETVFDAFENLEPILDEAAPGLLDLYREATVIKAADKDLEEEEARACLNAIIDAVSDITPYLQTCKENRLEVDSCEPCEKLAAIRDNAIRFGEIVFGDNEEE